MNQNDICVIFCMSVTDYPTKPNDISEAEKVPCPECKELMWLSVKKKAVLKLCTELKRNILHCCSRCLMNKAENGQFHPEEVEMVQI